MADIKFIDATYGMNISTEDLVEIIRGFNLGVKRLPHWVEGMRRDSDRELENLLVNRGWKREVEYDSNYPRDCGCCYGTYKVTLTAP